MASFGLLRQSLFSLLLISASSSTWFWPVELYNSKGRLEVQLIPKSNHGEFVSRKTIFLIPVFSSHTVTGGGCVENVCGNTAESCGMWHHADHAVLVRKGLWITSGQRDTYRAFRKIPSPLNIPHHFLFFTWYCRNKLFFQWFSSVAGILYAPESNPCHSTGRTFSNIRSSK